MLESKGKSNQLIINQQTAVIRARGKTPLRITTVRSVDSNGNMGVGEVTDYGVHLWMSYRFTYYA